MNRIVRIAKRVQHVGLYLLCAFLPFSNSAIEIAFGILLIGWVVEHGLQKGLRHSVWSTRTARLCGIAVIAYLVWSGLSFLWSTQVSLSLHGWFRKTLEYVLLFVIVTDIAQDRAVLKRAVLVLLGSAFVLVGDSIAQEILGYDPIRHRHLNEFSRMTGPFSDPNGLSSYFLPMIPIALCVGWGKAIRPHILWLALSLALIACLVHTRSDAALLGLLITLVILCVCHHSFRWPIAVVMLVLLIFVGDQLSQQVHIVATLAFDQDAGLQDRKSMWGAAWSMIAAHPFLGLGLNTFMDNYMQYCKGTCFGPSYAHNTFLQVAAETGLIGLSTLLFILGTILSAWIRALRSSLQAQGAMWWILLGLGTSMIAYLVQTTFETTFYMLRLATLFWVVSGLMVGLSFSILNDRDPEGSSHLPA